MRHARCATMADNGSFVAFAAVAPRGGDVVRLALAMIRFPFRDIRVEVRTGGVFISTLPARLLA